MARRGSFGRSPRPAASLTNTIISIAREMQQQRDQNIVDAWMKGGKFEGHKVTDEQVLAHWKQRMSQVAKNDPMYDMYQNAYLEYDYSINESKMRTGYAQGKVSDTQAASFYLNWSKKVPKNSEFWRILQRDAAEYTRAAKAKSDAEAKRLAELRYNNNQKALHDKYMAGGEFIQDVFTNLARRGLRPGGGNPLVDPMTGELYHFEAEDVQEMLGMVERLIRPASESGQVLGDGKLVGPEGTKAGPNTIVAYHDPLTDKDVTAADIAKKLKSLGFHGPLTLDNLYTNITNQKEGLQKAARLAESTGHLSDAAGFKKQLAVVAEVGREWKAWPVEQNYLDAREQMLQVVNDPSASQFDIAEALDDYKTKLGKYVQDPRVAANDVFINKLKGEINGDEGTTTLAEDFTGLNNVEPKDVAKMNVAQQRAEASIQAVESGQAHWTTGEWTNDGQFVPSPGGSVVGPATDWQIGNNSGGIPTQTIWMQDKNGRTVPVTVLGQNVTTHAYGPDGKELATQPGSNPVVAQIYALPNGRQVVGYQSGGKTLYTDISNAPWGNGRATLTENDKGFDLRIQVPQTNDGLKNSGFQTVPQKGGGVQLVYTPTDAMLGTTDPAHANLVKNGNGDPNTDFRSPNLAYYSSAKNAEDAKTLYQLSQNPTFQKQVDMESKMAVGGQLGADEKGNPIIVGYDQNAYNTATAQSKVVTTPGIDNATGLLAVNDRSTPASKLAADERFQSGHMDEPVAPLAVGQLKDTPMALMGNTLAQDTLNRLPAPSDNNEPRIEFLKSIKAVAPPKVTPMSATFAVRDGDKLNPTATVGGQNVSPSPSASQQPAPPPPGYKPPPGGPGNPEGILL